MVNRGVEYPHDWGCRLSIIGKFDNYFYDQQERHLYGILCDCARAVRGPLPLQAVGIEWDWKKKRTAEENKK